MKTASTTLKRPLAGLRRRLRGRQDTEHVMSLNRFVFCVLVSVLFNGAGIGPAHFGPSLFVVGMLVTLGIFAHLLVHPGPHIGRRGFALIADMTAICLMLHVGGEQAAVLFPMILWTIFGNGLRLGLPWLCAATAIGFSGFCLVAATTPFWSGHVPLTTGLAVGLVVLPAYAVVLIRDMTRARRQAEAANEAKSAFLANVSHELRTPLQAIIGMGDLLRGTGLTPEQAELSRTIAGASRSLLRMIDELLNFSKIEAGEVAAEEVEFDAVALLAEVRSLMLASCKAKGLRFALHVGLRTPPRVRGDQRHVREVLLNLAGNAVKFTRDGGVLLSVDLAETGAETGEGRPMLLFALTDTGIGVPAEARDRIFDRFAQADGTIAERFGGTGLGLAICKRLVAALGGRIGVRDGIGRGSTFWFEIPVALPAAPAPPAAASDGLPIAVILPDGAAKTRLVHGAARRGCRVHPVAPGAVPVSRAVGDALAEGRCVFVQTPGTERDRLELEAALGRPDGGPAYPCVVLVGGPAAPASGPDPRWLGPIHLADGFTDDDVSAALALTAVLARRHAPDPAPAAARGRRCHVLVADDNRTNRLVLSKILESGGHTYEVVGDGDEALTALGNDGYDLVLMDVNMPGTDGLEATKLQRFAELGLSRVPIVGLTADASPEMARRCKDAGMDACVTKPVSAEGLLDVVERLAKRGEPAAPRRPERADGGGETAEAGVLDAYLLAGLEGVGGKHFVSEVAGEFTREADAAIRQMAEAVDEDDAAKFRFNAHALASSAANVGAIGVRKMGLSLEQMPEGGIRLQGRERVRDLIRELDRFVHALAAPRAAPRAGGAAAAGGATRGRRRGVARGRLTRPPQRASYARAACLARRPGAPSCAGRPRSSGRRRPSKCPRRRATPPASPG